MTNRLNKKRRIGRSISSRSMIKEEEIVISNEFIIKKDDKKIRKRTYDRLNQL
jgi:hypothetical protein